MTPLLTFFQVKTTRSAWALLAGSVIMLLWGLYVRLGGFSEPPDKAAIELHLTLSVIWGVVTGAGIVIAGWVLFSEKGRAYLSAQEHLVIKGNRTIGWLIKLLLACYGAAFGTWMLLSVLALPFVGYAGFMLLESDYFWTYILLIGVFWSPIFYRYLK